LAAGTTFVGSKLLVFHIVLLKNNDKRQGNEREHPISTHIASHDGGDNLSCHVALMTATTTFRVMPWQQQPHRVQVHGVAQQQRLIISYRAMAMTTICAPRDGNDNKTTAVTTTLLPMSHSFVSYHIR
jgi:hypothetical protein